MKSCLGSKGLINLGHDVLPNLDKFRAAGRSGELHELFMKFLLYFMQPKNSIILFDRRGSIWTVSIVRYGRNRWMLRHHLIVDWYLEEKLIGRKTWNAME